MDLPFVCDGRENAIKCVIAIENRDIQKVLSLVIKNPSKYDF